MTHADGREQKQVQAYFAARSVFWKQVYEHQDVYATIHQFRRDLVLEWVDSIALPAGERAMDAGCGAGLFSVELARRGYRVDAIDSVQSMVEQTRQAALAGGVAELVSASAGDVCSTGFAEAAYSLVLLIGVLPWLESPERALRQAANALRPGGYLVATDDNVWRLERLLDPWVLGKRQAVNLLRRCGVVRPAAVPQPRQSSLSRFRRLLFESGFEPLRAHTFGFGPFTLFNRRILPDGAGVAVHGFLQRLAERGVPILRATGTQHLVLARRR